MSSRLPPLHRPPIGFGQAISGPSDQESPLERLRDAIDRLDAGVAAEVWLTADEVPVIGPGPKVGPRLRRRPISSRPAVDQPDSVVALGRLLEVIGPTRPLSLDVGDVAAFEAIIDQVRGVGDDSERRLWLCHDDIAALTSWRARTTARLVNVASYRSLDGGLEARAALVEQRGIDGLRLHHHDWTGGRVALLHRFERLALAGATVHEREAAAVIDAGIDAVYSPRIGSLLAVLEQFHPRP